MGLKLAEKGFRQSAGSWWGKIVDDDGKTVAETWGNSAEEIDKWFAEQVARRVTSTSSLPHLAQALADVPSAPAEVEVEAVPLRVESEDLTPVPKNKQDAERGVTRGKRK